MRLPHSSLIVVTDGEKRLFFRNRGDEAHADLVVEEVAEQDNPANRDQRRDRQGSKPSGGDTRNSSTDETDFHDQAERGFAKETAELIHTRALAGNFKALVVVAPPRTLGELRKHYHRDVADRLVGEVAKDLTNHPVDQIEALLTSHD